MNFDEPDFLRMVRELQRRDDTLRRHVQMLQGSTDFIRPMAAALQQGRELERLSQSRIISDALSTQRLALASTGAFDSFYSALQRGEWALGGLRRSVEQTQVLYEQARLATLSTCRIELSLRDWLPPTLAPLHRQLDALSLAASEVLAGWSAAPAAFAALRDWHVQAPTILPFAAAASLTVLGGVAASEADLPAALDDALDAMGENVEEQLSRTSPALAEPYRGAVRVLTAVGPDWQRHLGASLRSVVDGVLEALAPDDDLVRFFADPEALKEEGRFTRRARLEYIFREVGTGSYAQMSENDIEMTLATFYPSNKAVHELVPALDERQGKVLLRRVQGCLATILATRE